jgi:hypothetical protein
MTRIAKSKLAVAAVSAFFWTCGGAVVSAAPAAGGAVGGAGAGAAHGGGAVSSGAGHAGPAMPGGAGQSHAEAPHGIATPGGAPSPGQTSHTENHGGVQEQGNVTIGKSDHQGHDGHDHSHRRFNGYGTTGSYYTYPYTPFSYGYNGWYGNNYGDDQSQFYLPQENLNNNENTANNNGNTNTGNYVVPPPSSAQPPSAPPSDNEANLKAQETNAVEKSPAMVAANNSVQQAQSALDSATQRDLAALRAKPDYQQALARRHAASSDVHQARASSGTDSPAVVNAATKKLDAGDDVTKMEAEAVANDLTAAAAKARLDQAIADRNVLRAQLTATAENKR